LIRFVCQLLFRPRKSLSLTLSRGNELDEADKSRLVAALQAVFCSSFPHVTSPMDIDTSSVGRRGWLWG
jgi:hypothetical protein